MKRWLALLCIGAALLAACAGTETKTYRDIIENSPAARLELPDGTSLIVDSEIAVLRSLAEMTIEEAAVRPADGAEGWLYRIVFNPPEKVHGAEELAVSFYEAYVQIGDAYYRGAEGVPYEEVLEWAESKLSHFGIG